MAARPATIHDQPPPEFFLLSHIARMDCHAFVKAYKDASFDDLVEAALISVHGKAAYATKKFRWLKRAVNATLLSLGFIVVTSLVAIAARVFA